MLDQILTLPASEAVHLLADHAAWAWTVENSLLAAASGAIVVSGGMGVDDQFVLLPREGEETYAFLARLRLARQTECDILSPMNRGASAVNAGCQTHVWSSTD